MRAAAVLADGTLVIWLVLGLSSSPRRTPETTVCSSPPQQLPPAATRAARNFAEVGLQLLTPLPWWLPPSHPRR